MFNEDRYNVASRAMGTYDSRKEVDWLLVFAQAEPEAWTTEERLDTRYRLMVLLARGGFGRDIKDPPDIQENPGWSGFGEDAPLPSWDQVRDAQQRVQEIVRQLLRFQEVTLPLMDMITLKLSTAYTPGLQTALLTVESQSPITPFLLRLATLLRTHGGYIRECDNCQRDTCQHWFLKRRKDQKFCSQPCMNREMQRRFREVPPKEKAHRKVKTRRRDAARRAKATPQDKRSAARTATRQRPDKTASTRRTHDKQRTRKGGKHHGSKR